PGTPPDSETDGVAAGERWLENRYLRVELNAEGDIVRLYDKVNGRDVMPAGAVANRFQAFLDRPLRWDAWDVDIFYEEEAEWPPEPAESVRVVEAGPLRATLEVRRRILESPYVQRLTLTHNSPRLDVETHIEWRERHVLLKVAFPVDVLSPTATYEIQWGHVQRPTHRNTSWDLARFEVVAHKWTDLSEGGYGVSLLNNGKYGHDVRDNVIRLTLLRSPAMPDPQADRGEHHFVYSLLPHAGPLGRLTIAEAYSLNDPLILFPVQSDRSQERKTYGTGVLPGQSLVAVDAPHVVIETVKWAERGQGFIVRLYEAQRVRGPVGLHVAVPFKAAWRVNLLEEEAEPLEVEGRRISFFIKPFEIVTVYLEPAPEALIPPGQPS
ncbi:MAG: glycoside hydrolase family 38 C-terminal domain-containing protein, partial [Ardenticatenia bacterium]|nr:glycoside hydrolase family 38 C-terminal domain-containing protein [Ardenticatenia bacterium]